jgi:CRP-like cAMP-binding protein
VEATPELVERLARISIFSQLPPSCLERIASIVVPFEADAGHVLVQPGMVGAGLFLLEEGSVTLSVHDHEVELGPGEFVGELAILDDRAVHTTRVKTKTPTNGYCLSRDAFDELLQTEPAIAVPMLRVLARRLVDTVNRH